MKHYMSEELIRQYEKVLTENEKSPATIEKYLRDIRGFQEYAGSGSEITKDMIMQYKQKLQENYAVASVNSMLAALNSFFKEMGWYDCVVKSLKIQRDAFRSGDKELTKEEYLRLLKAAREKGNRRLYLVMQTICSTGIRVSELRFITVNSLNTGRAIVYLKGKTRTVLLPPKLCRQLKLFAGEKGIRRGSIFVTRNGRPLDRSNILHDMKELCERAGVDRKKIYPHNLRHLFAVTYYRAEKDLTHLADILGHSNINTTRIYTLTNGEEYRRQMELLGLVI